MIQSMLDEIDFNEIITLVVITLNVCQASDLAKLLILK